MSRLNSYKTCTYKPCRCPNARGLEYNLNSSDTY